MHLSLPYRGVVCTYHCHIEVLCALITGMEMGCVALIIGMERGDVYTYHRHLDWLFVQFCTRLWIGCSEGRKVAFNVPNHSHTTTPSTHHKNTVTPSTPLCKAY